ncbi:YhcH/YjgK/YiaL family protein [Paenibacillus sp. HJGM_3]|uniref:YhcH/YjgK/YiaL family protein n=1 Tax=Paenibacillus sp. HJGM_3 TaxID=3379816 RepID=UPI003870A5E1
MVIDSLKHASQYYGLHPRLAVGLRFLQEQALNGLEPGKYEIEGSDIYYLVQHYESKPLEAGKWEAHRKYYDIQYVVEGTERFGYAPLDSVRVTKEYEEESDYALFEGEGSFCLLPAGSFAIVAPQDAHMPGIAVQEPAPVKKIVVKVLI